VGLALAGAPGAAPAAGGVMPAAGSVTPAAAAAAALSLSWCLNSCAGVCGSAGGGMSHTLHVAKGWGPRPILRAGEVQDSS
jgi:hypothetical protein